MKTFTCEVTENLGLEDTSNIGNLSREGEMSEDKKAFLAFNKEKLRIEAQQLIKKEQKVQFDARK